MSIESKRYSFRRLWLGAPRTAPGEQRRGPKSQPNHVAFEVEKAILALSLEHPTYSAQRIANELRLRGVNVSRSGALGVWLCHEPETRYKRLMRLEILAPDETILLSEETGPASGTQFLQVPSAPPRGQRPLNQDTFYLATLKEWASTPRAA